MNDIMGTLARIAAAPLCAQGIHEWPSEMAPLSPIAPSDECRFCGKSYSHWWLERTLEALDTQMAQDTGVGIAERIVCGEGGHGTTTLVESSCPCGCGATQRFRRCCLCLDITEIRIESCLSST